MIKCFQQLEEDLASAHERVLVSELHTKELTAQVDRHQQQVRVAEGVSGFRFQAVVVGLGIQVPSSRVVSLEQAHCMHVPLFTSCRFSP